MVKRTNKAHRKQTKSELRKAKKASHTAGVRQGDFVHPSIAAAWDRKRTLKQNYKALGLAADPNDRKQRQKQSERLTHVDIDASEEELRQQLTRKRKRGGEEHRLEEVEEEEVEEGEEDEAADEAAEPLKPAAQQLHEELREMQRLGEAAPPYRVKVIALLDHPSAAFPPRLLFLTISHLQRPLSCSALLHSVDVTQRAASAPAADRQARRGRAAHGTRRLAQHHAGNSKPTHETHRAVPSTAPGMRSLHPSLAVCHTAAVGCLSMPTACGVRLRLRVVGGDSAPAELLCCAVADGERRLLLAQLLTTRSRVPHPIAIGVV